MSASKVFKMKFLLADLIVIWLFNLTCAQMEISKFYEPCTTKSEVKINALPCAMQCALDKDCISFTVQDAHCELLKTPQPCDADSLMFVEEESFETSTEELVTMDTSTKELVTMDTSTKELVTMDTSTKELVTMDTSTKELVTMDTSTEELVTMVTTPSGIDNLTVTANHPSTVSQSSYCNDPNALCPIAIRISNGNRNTVRIHFSDTDKVIRYNKEDFVTRYYTGDYSKVVTFQTFYENIDMDNVDDYYMADHGLTVQEFVYAFNGSEVILLMNKGTTKYQYTKTDAISSIYPNSPATVDAATYDEYNDTVYLIKADIVYQYTATVHDSLTTPYTYTFSRNFLITDNNVSPSNPFRAAMGTAPTGIHALVMDGNWAVAFSGACMFEYDATSETWTNHGAYPCDHP